MRRYAIGIAIAATVTVATTPAAAAEIVSRPVAFRVSNSNTSMVPCPSDGATYTVRGHLTAPREALSSPRAVTLYLFGYDAGEWNWRLTGVPRYDFAAQMAHAGHASLTIDELGYGASDHPDGMATCMGAQGDMAHQVVAKLRSGDYTRAGERGIAFPKVVVAGHDVGGLVAEIEAYSYRDIDGLVQVTWADQGQTPYIVERATQAGANWCTLDPQPQSDAAGSPPGYHHFTLSAQEMREKLFYDADPAVLDAATRLRARNPCGMIRSAPTATTIDRLHADEISVPVLVAFGDEDTLVWTREGEEQQADNYSASPDRTTYFVPNAGHFPMLEKTAPRFAAVLASWLSRHGFGGRAIHTGPAELLPASGQRIAVGRRRTARVKVTCLGPRGAHCHGALGLRALSRHGRRERAGRPVSRVRRLSVAAGGGRRVDVPLSRHAYRDLRRRNKMRVLVIVRRGPHARATRTVATLVLRAGLRLRRL